jgi:hypothetical protein
MRRPPNRRKVARALIFGFLLAASEAVTKLFQFRNRIAVIFVLRKIPEPQHFYINIDERVFAIKLHN